MTKAQIVRKKFKTALPRTIRNRQLSKLEAMARTMELFDKFRDEMGESGLKKTDVSAGLVYTQPETRGMEGHHIIKLPLPEEIGRFVEEVWALNEKKTLFLGVVFRQEDHEATKREKKVTAFVWPFMGGPEAEKRLIDARKEFGNEGDRIRHN